MPPETQPDGVEADLLAALDGWRTGHDGRALRRRLAALLADLD